LLARRAADAASIDETFAPVARLLDDVVIAAQEAGRAASDYLDGMTHDPRELEHIDERLETVRRLAKKYGGSLADVLAERARAADERASLGNLDAAIKSADDAAARAEKELAGAAAGLSKDRRAAAKKLAKSIDAELADMAMNGAHFDVAFIAVPDGAGLLLGDRRDVGQSRDRQGAGGPDLTLTRVESTGAERAEFLLAANPGEPARPLARVASGGELSRVMLAIKNSLARAFHVPTLIFDEVDQGLGGAQAEVVGRKLASVAQNHQVLCITHLPRIAGLADRHLVVAKEQAGGRTVTRVREVAKAEREDELARMVGGVTITNADRAAAREMLAPSQSRVSAPEKKRAPRQAKGG
ncbi:DNA repair protein RecN, partial [bacterium]|nr:DNA repair protein RecN [bacterium]